MQPPIPDPDFAGDPYDDPMLNELEDSIEQHLPIDAYDSDLAPDMLEAVEDSVGQAPVISGDSPAEPVRDPLWDMLDKIETDTERQVVPPEAYDFEPPAEPVPEVFGSFESRFPQPDREEHLIGERPLPPGLSKGSQGTGCRYSKTGDGSSGWCQLHSRLVSSMECEECNDNTGGSECEYWSDV